MTDTEQQTLPGTENPDGVSGNQTEKGNREAEGTKGQASEGAQAGKQAKPQVDETAEALKAAQERIAAFEKAEKERELAKLSEEEQLAAKREAAQAEVARLEREAAFLAEGLPKALAGELSPKDVAKIIHQEIKKGLALKGVGDPLKPTSEGAGKTSEDSEPEPPKRKKGRKDPYYLAAVGKKAS